MNGKRAKAIPMGIQAKKNQPVYHKNQESKNGQAISKPERRRYREIKKEISRGK